jgi:hypothetical protein
MNLAQVMLKDGTTYRTCWVEAKIKTGDKITLKNSEEPDRWWSVYAVGTTRKQASEIPRGWHNNI